MEFIFHYSLLIISVIISLILTIIVLSQCFLKGKIYKGLLIASIVNLLLNGIFALLYDKYIINSEMLKWILCSYVMLLLIVFSTTIVVFLTYFNHKIDGYEQFVSSLNKTTWNVYLVCDKNDRIKEISSSFLSELGMKESDVIGKKAFDIFDKAIRFTKINDNDMTNKTLREYYRTFPKSSRPNEEYQREIYFQNCNGQTVVFNLIEKPIFVGNKYCGRIDIGQKKTDEVLASVERELIDRNRDLESIQHKFIAALELTEEGMFFNDLEANELWANDVMVKELNLRGNSLGSLEYKQLIHPEDLAVYTSMLQGLTPHHPHYSITYRFKIKNSYEFVKEQGKRVFEDANNKVILGFTRKIITSDFEKTHLNEVDSIKNFDDLLRDLDILYKEHRLFQLVCVNLTSLPEINAQYGRKTGNLIMSEYLKKLRNNFITESGDLYRAGGLVFYFTITDNRKMEFFRRGLTSDSSIMNLTVNYAGVKAELKVHLGIAEAMDDGICKEELIKNCNAAVNTALNPNFNNNYVYYRDLRDVGIR